MNDNSLKYFFLGAIFGFLIGFALGMLYEMRQDTLRIEVPGLKMENKK